MWGPGQRYAWGKETGQPVKQEMWVPFNRSVKIRFINSVEITTGIGQDAYKVWLDEAKNIKMRHEKDVLGNILAEEPVSIPWGVEQRSVIKRGSVTFSRGNKGEYSMVYQYRVESSPKAMQNSILKWESKLASTYDYEGVHATGDTGKYNDNFGNVDTSRGTMILTSGPKIISGIVEKPMQLFMSRKEFIKSKLDEIQSYLDETAKKGLQEIKNYRAQHPRAGNTEVSASLVVMTKDAKERGVLVGVNAGNLLYWKRQLDKKVYLLSSKKEADALGAQNTTSEIKLDYFIRYVNPGDMVVAVSPAIADVLDTKSIEQIIFQNDDLKEIRRQLMEKANAVVTDTRGKINNMTVAILKISPEVGDLSSEDQAMSAVSDRIHDYWLKIDSFKGDDYRDLVRKMIYDEVLRKYVSWHEKDRIRDPNITFYTRRRALEVLFDDIRSNYRLEIEKQREATERVQNQLKLPMKSAPRNISDEYQEYLNSGELSNRDEKGALRDFILTLRIMNAQDRKAMSDTGKRWDLIERIGINHHLQPGYFKNLIQKKAMPWVMKQFPTGYLASSIKANRDKKGADQAMNVLKGGIDLTPANMNLQTQNAGGMIKSHLDPAMLKQLQNAPGFVPVIFNIQPMNDLRKFLGISDAQNFIGV
jgi:hypothetical protein